MKILLHAMAALKMNAAKKGYACSVKERIAVIQVTAEEMSVVRTDSVRIFQTADVAAVGNVDPANAARMGFVVNVHVKIPVIAEVENAAKAAVVPVTVVVVRVRIVLRAIAVRMVNVLRDVHVLADLIVNRVNAAKIIPVIPVIVKVQIVAVQANAVLKANAAKNVPAAALKTAEKMNVVRRTAPAVSAKMSVAEKVIAEQMNAVKMASVLLIAAMIHPLAVVIMQKNVMKLNRSIG